MTSGGHQSDFNDEKDFFFFKLIKLIRNHYF